MSVNRFTYSDAKNADSVTADICVIGSGPGGAIPAVALAQYGHKVVLLESGPRVNGHGAARITNLVVTDGVPDLPVSGILQLGGSSNLWAGRIAPLEVIDFEERRWVPRSGWPVNIGSLPYKKAFALLTAGDEMMMCLSRHSSVPIGGVTEDSELEVKPFYWANQPFNTAQYLEKEASELGGKLQIVLNSPVVELKTSASGNFIEAASIRLPDGGLQHVRAKIFILAAGGLETPRILLSSTGVNGCGIGNEHDLVGRYLSTHPKADVATLTLKRRVGTDHPLFTDQNSGRGRMRLGLGFNAATQRELGLLNHYVQLSPFLEYRASVLFEVLRRSSFVQSPLIDGRKIARNLLPSLGQVVFEGISRLAGLQNHARVFILRAFLDQYPNNENRVQLSSAYTDDGIRKVDVRWSFSRQDRESVIKFLSRLSDRLVQHDLGTVEYDKLLAIEGNWPITSIHSHFMGTTRMGMSERDGVVNADCRVFSQTNLYVSGPSVFPTYGYANPFLTIAALGLRLADHIHLKLKQG